LFIKLEGKFNETYIIAITIGQTYTLEGLLELFRAAKNER
jgi:hypothetical protein